MYSTLADILVFLKENWLPVILSVVGASVLVLLIYASIVSHNEWLAWCESEGGHVVSDTDTNVGTGIDGSGNVTTVVTSSTDYYCLSETGGILDIR